MPLPAHPPGVPVAVDSHVHLHDLRDPAALLDGAYAALTGCLGHRPPPALLILTEPESRPTFARLREIAAAGRPTADLGCWRIGTTDEPISLAARHRTGDTIYLLAGQQIVTAENLEVLSLLALPEIADGLGLAETVLRIRQLGGLPVLPWGVGKWLGRRGTTVSDFLAGDSAGPLFVGDNGGRPGLWAFVPQFRQARAKNIRILRGSDPLRCSFRRRSAGSYGNILRCHFDPARPGQSLYDALTAAGTALETFGRHESLWHFLRDQIALRIS
ncbi:MAG: hypothetical protein F9K32_18025 [Desulfobulbaceae bacterium]|nr:MAG: hypothetical protein F9K32_18025 [Desulfobulbaceae bacterium]